VGGIVVAPGKGEKALLDELVVAVLGGLSTKPHLHRAHTDYFYVFEGELELAGTYKIGASDLGYAPPGAVHWFEAPEAMFLNIHAPGDRWKLRSLARQEGRTIDDATGDSFDPPERFTPEAYVVGADEGGTLADGKRTIQIKVARPELCVFEFDAHPGYTGPGPHLHREHVDAFYVLEGALEFELDGELTVAGKGTFVAATPGVVHTFKNAAAAPVRFLNLHAPGMRFDEYFRRQAAGEDDRGFHESFDVYEMDANEPRR
jgi:quercetin dioxygenase-like cupin family protein